ncbi:MAG: S8 family serine peptidase [Pleurocapsa sp. SU_196_0]|nr:S8 family serine peptidase [Pleurocapsa sp. SU_196_0]
MSFRDPPAFQPRSSGHWVDVGVAGGCPEPPAPLEYRISTVQPQPVTPGESLTVFGVLPANARLELNTTPLESRVVSDGYSFTIPSNTIAGEHTLRVSSGKTNLETTVDVDPRLDRVSLQEDTLRLEGAGWNASTNVRVILNALEVTPSIEASSLEVKLTSSHTFGALSVSVRIADRTSNTLNLSREAGSITGKVVLPATVTASPRVQVQATRQPRSSRVLTTRDPGVVREALEIRALPALGLWRITYSSAEEAQRGLETLHARGIPARLEIPVTPTDGLHTLETLPPPTPGVGQWSLEPQGIPTAWTRSTGTGITIAIIDMGVHLEHPDLKTNLLPGYDFVNDDADPSPTSSNEGHGTHVAGLVAARGNVMGVAPTSRLLPVRVLNAQGGTESTVALGILWAANLIPTQPNPNKADIINLSLGAGAFSSLIAEAVTRAQQAGVIVVAAAGNDGSATVSYPAALPGVIAVTALAGPITPYQPFYASHGPGVWVTAYGGDTTADQDGNGVPDGILSTDVTESGYGLRMGTSMACPQVAGLIALALSSGTPAFLARDSVARTASDLGAWGWIEIRLGTHLRTQCHAVHASSVCACPARQCDLESSSPPRVHP